jgi:hypothetical protein
MRMKQPDEEFQVVRMFSSVKYFNRNEMSKHMTFC